MKTPIKFSVKDLQAEINKVGAGTFCNVSALSKFIADTSYCKNLKPGGVSSTWVYLKIKEHDLRLPEFSKAEKHKIPDGFRAEPGVGAKKRAERKQSKSRQAWIESLRQRYTDEVSKKLVDKIEKGSSGAERKLKCIDCCNGDKKSIKLCTITSCSLWFNRPYRDKQGEKENADILEEASCD